MKNLFLDALLTRLAAATTTATTEVDFTHIDMGSNGGFDGVAFVSALGTANAGNYFKVQGGNASDDSDMADIAGSKYVPASNALGVMITVEKSPFRYLRLVAIRAGATTTVEPVNAIQYHCHQAPQTNAGKELINPVAGTA
jgi:hypothetical protein